MSPQGNPGQQQTAKSKRRAERRRRYQARYYREHRDEIRTRTRLWAAAHPEWIRKYNRSPERKASHARWHAAHPDKVHAWSSRYYKEHKDERREKFRSWAAANRERVREYNRSAKAKAAKNRRSRTPKGRISRKLGQHRRRARMTQAGGSFTAREWQALCRQYRFRCPACGKRVKLTVDHITPISKGGTNYIDNIQPLCAQCNRTKRANLIPPAVPRQIAIHF